MAFRSIGSPPSLPPPFGTFAQWCGQVAAVVAGIMRGKINAVIETEVTLTPSAATTTINDPRISIGSWIGLCPRTAHARAELATATGVYVSSISAQTATLTHVNSATADRTFRVVVIG